MEKDELFDRYQRLQRYVSWTAEDAQRIQAVEKLLRPDFDSVIDDFYDEVERHPEARQVISGGDAQIQRLKATLLDWLSELFSGPYDADFVWRRFRVGARHVAIGLDQVYTNVALSRIRRSLQRSLANHWHGSHTDLLDTVESLNKLLDLDLAVIEDAYQAEYTIRQQQNERLATLGQVAAGVAHELRNPLNAVKTSVYYLRNAKNPSAEKMAEHLERIDRQVGLSDRVITALSEFSKLPLPNLRPVSVLDLIRETLEPIDHPENIKIQVEIPDSLGPVLADPPQLAIALSNVFRNGLEAMPDGGTLAILGREADLDSPAGGMIEILIVDTGVGIPAENLLRITEPLFSTKARGIGLGLALTQAILGKHNSRLTAESEAGQGTTIIISVPKAPA